MIEMITNKFIMIKKDYGQKLKGLETIEQS
jgi:hypothetical protein